MAAKVADDGNHWIFKCPACGLHYIRKGKGWHFDGNVESPTISPSLVEITNSTNHPHHQPDVPMTRCHLFVSAGKIEFLNDCTHPYGGQTIEMTEFSEDELKRYERKAIKSNRMGTALHEGV